ncbi:hypothetical protein ACFQXA_32065 [Nocardiopsis composta]
MWRTTETDPRVLSARSVAQRLDGDGHSAHLVWNPLHGDVAQLLPATAPAGGQLCPPPGTDSRSVPVDASADPACEGRICLIIVVIGRADEPFTDGPLAGAGALLRWLDSWGVPPCWPGGRRRPPPGRGRPRPRRGAAAATSAPPRSPAAPTAARAPSTPGCCSAPPPPAPGARPRRRCARCSPRPCPHRSIPRSTATTAPRPPRTRPGTEMGPRGGRPLPPDLTGPKTL